MHENQRSKVSKSPSSKGEVAYRILGFCKRASSEQNRKSLILTKRIQIITNIADDF